MNTWIRCIIVAMLTCPLQAQLTKIPRQDFSEQATGISFAEFRSARGPANNILGVYGVRFDSEAIGTPTIWEILTGPDLIRSPLRNRPPEGQSSADDALVVTLDEPAKRVGFVLGNGGEGVVARLRAFTKTGILLGEVEEDGIPLESQISPDFGTFVGLETTHPLGISKVVIDYGDAERGEQINTLLLDPQTPRAFRIFLPLFASGPAGTLSLTSRFSIQALTLSESNVKLAYFDPEGNPLDLGPSPQTPNLLEFSLPGFGTRSFTTTLSNSVISGYGTVESSDPVAAQVIFEVRDAQGRLVSEAETEAGPARLYHVLGVAKEAVPGIETGIAISNINSESVTLRLDLRQSDGETPEGIRSPARTSLGPGTQLSFFLGDYCALPQAFGGPPCEGDFLSGEEFYGTLILKSSLPVVVTSLRTRNGLPTFGPIRGTLSRD